MEKILRTGDSSARNVYGIQSGRFIKIGVATSIANRMKIMRLSNPHGLTVVYRRKMRAAYHCEKKMHEILKDKALGREWFDITVEELREAAAIGVAYAKQFSYWTEEKFWHTASTGRNAHLTKSMG